MFWSFVGSPPPIGKQFLLSPVRYLCDHLFFLFFLFLDLLALALSLTGSRGNCWSLSNMG